MRFEIKSGKLNITDPCCEAGYTLALYDLAAKNGLWSSEVATHGVWDRVNSKLLAYHTESAKGKPVGFDQMRKEWKSLGTVAVVTGQAGVFDAGEYPQGPITGHLGDLSTFYGKACKITLESDNLFGVVDSMGVVSRSGCGDGTYEAFGQFEADELTAVLVVFVLDSDGVE